jgi:hypothetical protein
MDEEAWKTIRRAMIQAQLAIAAYVGPNGPDARTTISRLLKVLDSTGLLEALAETEEFYPAARTSSSGTSQMGGGA